jgi:hypothetical protein
VQAEPRNTVPQRKTLPAFPIPLSRDDAKPLRVIEHYLRVVQFARDLLRSTRRDETAENKALTACVRGVKSVVEGKQGYLHDPLEGEVASR